MTTQEHSFKTMREKAVQAALGLAATRPWQDVTLADIARVSRLDPALFRLQFSLKEDVLLAHARMMDEALPAFQTHPAQSEALKDKLFDVLMDRFDRLNDHRQAYLSILASLRPDPKQIILGLPSIFCSMQHVLEGVAGPQASQGLKGCAALAKLAGVYAYALWAWRDDQSADLPKTMAALDKALTKAGF